MSERKTTEERRREILIVSLNMFVSKGYYGTSTRKIASELGISSGLMYHYFESKEKLYVSLLQEALQGVNRIENIPSSLSPIQVFENITDFLINTFSISPNTVKMYLLVKQTEHSDFLTNDMKDIMKKMDTVRKLVPIIEAGQLSGEIKAGEPLALSRCYFSCIQGVAETVACYPDSPLPQSSWIVDILRR